ncbi:hypothetical protein PAAG_04375 [Paracoccidioides lutzii Pb01]|uniref:Uncharacterized protein n=1 Tax=Paracoccidioides lutzii (strain ATCC MYA-826 / Pb01) TaxID=502779 RepID=C1H0T1_PARBA|nr:hypothetical protein PAAG_04375 [Paracoccidioides lutzii Pb01]EEH33325.2 hypothetical protein PAAG_04375 [Paracoccidioides lutzii Pb01]
MDGSHISTVPPFELQPTLSTDIIQSLTTSFDDGNNNRLSESWDVLSFIIGAIQSAGRFGKLINDHPTSLDGASRSPEAGQFCGGDIGGGMSDSYIRMAG